MKSSRTIKKWVFGLLCLTFLFSEAQFTQQVAHTSIAGGTTSGGTFSSEFGTNVAGGRPQSALNGFYLGLAAFNLPSATVTVQTNVGTNPIPDPVSGYLLRVEQRGNYDTLDIQLEQPASFSFNPVFLGDYLFVIDSDTSKYVATYYGDSFLWEESQTLVVDRDTTESLTMTLVPPPTTPGDGEGTVRGTIEEEFAEEGAEEGRIEARRRAARRKCGLQRETGGGRPGQTGNFVLFAYGETNDQGEFEFGFLPQGTYRFFVEYPGIPLDETSFVQFDIGEAGVTDDDFTLAATVTEEGIVVELILGLTSQFFTDFSVYPNPTTDKISVSYDKILSENLVMQLIDMNGNILDSRAVEKGKNGQLELSLQQYQEGIYFLKFYDEKSGDTALTFRVLKR